MCHENPNVERALAEMETAAEQLSMVQQTVNAPLLDILFKLVNYPQTPGLAGGKVKVLHTYAHKFLEFYMTECPDGVSIHTIRSTDVHAIAAKLRALGDGLQRLMVYLGISDIAEAFVEQVDTLAVAYDTFAVVMANAEAAHDAFYCEDEDDCDDDCDGCQGVGCPSFCHCGGCDCGAEEPEDETSWVKQHHEDDDSAEYDPEDDYGDDEEEDCDDCGNCSNCQSADQDREAAYKLFQKIFGFNPNMFEERAKAAAKAESKPAAKNEEVDEFADEMAGFLARMLGVKLEKKPAAAPKAETPKTEPKKDAEPSTEEILANALANILGCEVKVQKVAAPKPTRVAVREVRPGFWKFMEE